MTDRTNQEAEIARITAVSVFFLAGSVVMGGRFVRLFTTISGMRVRGMRILSALSFSFLAACMADLAGVRPSWAPLMRGRS